MQNHYNLVYREEEREMIPLCMDQGLADNSVEPLGARIPDGHAESRRRIDGCVHRWTVSRRTCITAKGISRSPTRSRRSREQRGVSSAAQVACAWVLQAPGVTAPIIGATKPQHIQELISAVDLKLSAEEVAALEKPYRPHPILGHAQPTPKTMVVGRG